MKQGPLQAVIVLLSIYLISVLLSEIVGRQTTAQIGYERLNKVEKLLSTQPEISNLKNITSAQTELTYYLEKNAHLMKSGLFSLWSESNFIRHKIAISGAMLEASLNQSSSQSPFLEKETNRISDLEKPVPDSLCRVPYFLFYYPYHLPSDVLLAITLSISGALGALLAKARSEEIKFINFKGFAIGLTTGFIIFLGVRGGVGVLTVGTIGNGGVDINPYSGTGIALLAGLFSQRFYEFLSRSANNIFGKIEKEIS